MSDEPATRLTVIGYLTAALGWVRSLDYGLDGARASLSKAYDLAIEEHRPVDQIVSLQHDLDALGELVGDIHALLSTYWGAPEPRSCPLR